MAAKRRRREDGTEPGSPAPETPVVPKFEFRTLAQQYAWDTISKNTVTFLWGSAGTGKTQVASSWSIQQLVTKRYKRLIHTRPIVEATESLGWLPGDVGAKVAPFMEPLRQCTEKARPTALLQIDTIPLAYMRGLTLENSICILDEAQNCTEDQLKLYLTRLGTNARMIICGDTKQTDIRDSGLYGVITRLRGLPGVGDFEFKPCDTVRHPLVEKILDRFD